MTETDIPTPRTLAVMLKYGDSETASEMMKLECELVQAQSILKEQSTTITQIAADCNRLNNEKNAQREVIEKCLSCMDAGIFPTEDMLKAFELVRGELQSALEPKEGQ